MPPRGVLYPREEEYPREIPDVPQIEDLAELDEWDPLPLEVLAAEIACDEDRRLCAGCRAGAENQMGHLGDGWSPGGTTRDLGCLRCHTAWHTALIDDDSDVEEVQGEPNADSGVTLTQLLGDYMEDEESQEVEWVY